MGNPRTILYQYCCFKCSLLIHTQTALLAIMLVEFDNQCPLKVLWKIPTKIPPNAIRKKCQRHFQTVIQKVNLEIYEKISQKFIQRILKSVAAFLSTTLQRKNDGITDENPWKRFKGLFYQVCCISHLKKFW